MIILSASHWQKNEFKCIFYLEASENSYFLHIIGTQIISVDDLEKTAF